jgi:hypothetical protein
MKLSGDQIVALVVATSFAAGGWEASPDGDPHHVEG